MRSALCIRPPLSHPWGHNSVSLPHLLCRPVSACRSVGNSGTFNKLGQENGAFPSETHGHRVMSTPPCLSVSPGVPSLTSMVCVTLQCVRLRRWPTRPGGFSTVVSSLLCGWHPYGQRHVIQESEAHCDWSANPCGRLEAQNIVLQGTGWQCEGINNVSPRYMPAVIKNFINSTVACCGSLQRSRGACRQWVREGSPNAFEQSSCNHAGSGF